MKRTLLALSLAVSYAALFSSGISLADAPMAATGFAKMAAAAPAPTPATVFAHPVAPAIEVDHSLDHIPPVLANLTNTGELSVLKGFQARSGLHGWVVRAASKQDNTIIYTTEDGETLIAGMLLDTAGENYTATYAKTYEVKVDYAPAFKAFSDNGDTAGVLVGSATAKAKLVVVMDANCGYCKLLHRLMAPAINAGELSIRYVPVAILGRDSRTKGAGLLASTDTAELMDNIANSESSELSEDKTLLEMVDSNNKAMTKFGFNGTPVVFYQTGGQGEETLHVSSGLPQLLPLFKSLGISGQISKLKADPQLVKYVK